MYAVLEMVKVLAQSIIALMKKLGNDLYRLEKVRNGRLVPSLTFFYYYFIIYNVKYLVNSFKCL